VKVVVLDRDGVINEDSDAYVKSLAEWRPIPGSLEAIARLSEAGFTLVVVSNQSGLARGLFDRATLDAIHAEMQRRVQAAGGRLAGIFFCPHAADAGCDCRKPKVGLLRQVEAELGVAVEGLPLVGDKASDLQLARRAGCQPILVRTGYGRATERRADLAGVRVFDDLAAVAEALIARDVAAADV
jgi:D-glycero-D-manno-heptose 1,7-bisphosphate phosphatase